MSRVKSSVTYANHSLNLTLGPVFSVIAVTVLFSLASRSQAQCEGTWTKRTPAIAPSARPYPAMVFDSVRGVTVLYGGTNGGDETWEWDGNNWTHRTPATSPAASNDHAMAFDSARGVTVLFNPLTWEWDGINWSQKSPSTSPSARESPAMAYDSLRHVTVLFGGAIPGGESDETWEWDGINWSKRASPTSPPGRVYHSMAYDSVRGVCVLFGGYNTAAAAMNDTWEWDGANWSKRSPATVPDYRKVSAMAYDSGRGVVVMFGGLEGSPYLADTWEWDGSNWTKRTPASPPGGRQEHAMAYDSARGATVLFGGTTASGASNETWEWGGPKPYLSQQPASQSVVAGQNAGFAVTASSVATISFHWRRNGTPLTDGGTVSGSATAALVINAADATNTGSYDCVVSNSCGEVVSHTATLDTCKAAGSAGDCNGNGVLDSCEIAANATLDADNNGVLDSCESAGSCGTCGAGMATMMPLAVIGLGAARRRLRPQCRLHQH
jgi:hypothetical protein